MELHHMSEQEKSVNKTNETITYKRALKSSTEYFDGDELAARVFVDKYALRDEEGNLLEETPTDMHNRLSKEIVRKDREKFDTEAMWEKDVFEYLDHFKYIVPQGSIMYGLGNPYQYISLSNCFVCESPIDSYSGIMHTDEQIVNISKRRGGCGVDISNLRPDGSRTKNSSRTSTGVIPFARRYSNTTREVGQCIEENQYVLVENKGLVKIKDVEDTDRVWTKIGFVDVTKKINSGIKHVYKVKTKSGYNVITSKDHAYQTFNEDGELTETKLEDLNIGDSIVLCIGNSNNSYNVIDVNLENSGYKNKNNKPSACELPTYLDEKLSYILGYMYGNGYVERNNKSPSSIELACSDDYPDIKEKLIKYFQDVFNYKIKKTNCDGKLEKLCIYNKTITQFLLYNNIIKEKSGDLVFPEKITNADINVQCSFISGYFDANGYNSGSKKGYCFSSIDKKFLEKIQLILNSFGILSKLHPENRSKNGWNTLYSMCVIDTMSKNKFYNLMENSIKVRNIEQKSNRDYWKTPFKAKSFGINSNNYNYCPDNSQFLSANDVSRLKNDEELVIDTLYQDEIINIEYIGEKQCYDLSLEKEYLFWCNGIYLHNSARRGALMITLSVHHPDILAFINSKKDKTQITGANISVKITDEFMKAVKNDEDYELRFPVDSKTPQYSKKISAKKIWDELITNVHDNAEPGILMWDNIRKDGPAECYKTFASKGTNPCVTKDMYILTTRGAKQVKDLVNKQFDAIVNGVVYPSSPKGFWKTGIKDVYSVKTEKGHQARCTKNHMFCTIHKNTHEEIWKPLYEIEVGSRICLSNHYNDNGHKTDKISEIKYDGKEAVYDCNIPIVNEFDGNGIRLHNCSELPLSHLDSCRLLLLNIFSFVENPFTDKAEFNWKKFYDTAKAAQRIMDNIVDLEIEYIAKIINKIKEDPEPVEIKHRELRMWEKIMENCQLGRRTGTGKTGIGDTIAALGHKYGSDESIRIIEKIDKAMKFACYESSIEMAEKLGTFPVFDYEKEKDCPFFQRFAGEVIKFDDVKKSGKELMDKMKKVGRRNIALLTTSPAGSVSLLTQTTSGIEPLFMMSATRRKKGNSNDEGFRTDYIDDSGDHWMEFEVYHPKLKMWVEITGETDIKKSPYYGSCAEDLDYMKRVKLQAKSGKHICSSISSTINLPEDVTVEEVKKIYEKAYDLGCKGITVYRKNCRSGVIVEKKKDIDKPENDGIIEERPRTLPCDVHHASVKGIEYFVLVGLKDGVPHEVFAGKNGFIPKRVKAGQIIRKRKNFYIAKFADCDTELSPITASNNEMEEIITRLTSLSLRTGADMHKIVQQLEKVGERQ
ncbi:MAG: hypothetical protein BAJALOKI3v1_1210001, partial [Promethearchaeota archaeon]